MLGKFARISSSLTSSPVIKWLSYKQGQYITPKIREYFYFIDHQGQLFLDDVKMKNFTSCFKEKDFLQFFFKRLKINETGRYEDEFPYFSPCGRERNYVRCDDLPIVFTHIIGGEDHDRLSYSGAGELLTVDFRPDAICMLPQSGRVYHPGVEKTGGVGLIKSSLAIELSKNFEFEQPDENAMPTFFTWHGTKHRLTHEIIPLLEKQKKLI